MNVTNDMANVHFRFHVVFKNVYIYDLNVSIILINNALSFSAWYVLWVVKISIFSQISWTLLWMLKIMFKSIYYLLLYEAVNIMRHA